MKLLWFHLMPYTELPEDFRDNNPSVWVDIHSSLFDPRRAHLMYNDFMDELEFAAECGFDAVCVNEHHSNGYGLLPSPNLVASALARRTDLVKYNTQLFAQRIMPQLRDVFPKWGDRWWPQPMDQSAPAPLSPFQPTALAAE